MSVQQVKYVEWFLVIMIAFVQVLMVTGCGDDQTTETQPIGLQSTPDSKPSVSPTLTPTPTPSATPSPSPSQTPVQDPWLDMQTTWLDRDLYWHDTGSLVRTDLAAHCIDGWRLPTADDAATLIHTHMPFVNGFAWLDDGVNLFRIPTGTISGAEQTTGGLGRILCVKLSTP